MTDDMNNKEVMKIDMGAAGTKTVNMSFPPNTRTKHVEQPVKEEHRKVEKVVQGSVVKRKKTLGKRFIETFVGEDANSVMGYILHDVLIPAAKSTLSDMVQGGIEMLLFGERKSGSSQRNRGRSHVNYGNPSYKDAKSSDRRDISSRNRARHNFDEIVLSSRGEAEEVLNHLVDMTIDYQQATVADLYDLVGITGNFTDNKYGWTDLGRASISRSRDGYLLNLPKPILLD